MYAVGTTAMYVIQVITGVFFILGSMSRKKTEHALLWPQLGKMELESDDL